MLRSNRGSTQPYQKLRLPSEALQVRFAPPCGRVNAPPSLDCHCAHLLTATICGAGSTEDGYFLEPLTAWDSVETVPYVTVARDPPASNPLHAEIRVPTVHRDVQTSGSRRICRWEALRPAHVNFGLFHASAAEQQPVTLAARKGGLVHLGHALSKTSRLVTAHVPSPPANTRMRPVTAPHRGRLQEVKNEDDPTAGDHLELREPRFQRPLSSKSTVVCKLCRNSVGQLLQQSRMSQY